MKTVCDLLNLDLSETLVFGDAMNDYELISVAGVGVVMGNGDERLKAIADIITKTNDDNGIDYVLDYLIANHGKLNIADFE